MDVPSQCTIVRTMSRPAHSSKLNTPKKETTVFCVCKESSPKVCISPVKSNCIRKLSVTDLYNNRSSRLNP
jgi:hypothetical protein